MRTVLIGGPHHGMVVDTGDHQVFFEMLKCEAPKFSADDAGPLESPLIAKEVYVRRVFKGENKAFEFFAHSSLTTLDACLEKLFELHVPPQTDNHVRKRMIEAATNVAKNPSDEELAELFDAVVNWPKEDWPIEVRRLPFHGLLGEFRRLVEERACTSKL